MPTNYPGYPFTPCYILQRVALESPTLEQKTLVPTIRTETQVDPLNLMLILESLYKLSFVCMKHMLNFSFTSVESTTLYEILA
jgi:hypothetical protein